MGLSAKQLPLQLRHFFVAQARARLDQLEKADATERKDALRASRKALRQLRKAAQHCTLRCHSLALEGRLCRIEGRDEKARQLLAQADELANKIDNPLVVFEVAIERAHLATANGDENAQTEARRRAHQLAVDNGWGPRLARAKLLGSASA